VDVTAVTDGTPTCSNRHTAGAHPEGATKIPNTPWNKFTKKMKAFEKNEQVEFESLTDFSRITCMAILTQQHV
jgi:hypothetical protein